MTDTESNINFIEDMESEYLSEQTTEEVLENPIISSKIQLFL